MAVHTAITLVVPHRPHSELEFGIQSETNITTGFGNKLKTATFNTYYYFVGLLFEVGASLVTSKTPTVPCYLVSKAETWIKLLTSMIPRGIAPRVRTELSRVARGLKIYCIRH